MRSRPLILLAAVAGSIAAASCAVVGYNLDGYGPAKGGASNGGGGGSNTTSGGGAGATSVGSSIGGGGGADCGASETCSEAPTKGFLGPVALLVDVATPSCDGDFPNSVFTGGASPSGAAAMCTCTCDTAPCAALVLVTTYSDATCATTSAAYSAGDNDGCNSVGPPGLPHVIVTPPKATGTCTPSAPTIQKPAAAFGHTVVACAGASRGAGCGAGEACYPKPKSPFDPGLCIYKTGDVACPSGLTKKLYFKSIDDTRSCTACACGAAAASCPVAVSLYSDTACATLLGSPVQSTCSAVAADWNSIKAKLTSPCAAIDGTPDGDVSGGGPTTFCCDE